MHVSDPNNSKEFCLKSLFGPDFGLHNLDLLETIGTSFVDLYAALLMLFGRNWNFWSCSARSKYCRQEVFCIENNEKIADY